MKRTSVRVFATATLVMLGGILFLAAATVQAQNVENDVLPAALDLGSGSAYSGGLPGPTSDVTFLLGTSYDNAASLTVSTAAISIGTLNDLNSAPLTIAGLSAGTARTITLNGGWNAVAAANGGAGTDLIYVSSVGNLSINAGGTKPLGLVLASDGNFNVASGGALAIGSAISGTGNVTKTGGGLLTLAGANKFVGGLTISSGTVLLGSASALTVNNSLAIQSGGVLDLNGNSNTVYSLSGSGVLTSGSGAATLTLGGAGANIYAGTITGPVGLTLSLTSGSLVLANANTYTGGTTVNAGELALDFSQPSAPTANIVNNAGNNSALTLRGALSVIGGGNSAISNTQQFPSTTIAANSASTVVANRNGAQALLVSLGDITGNAGGTVDFTLPSGAQNSTNGIATTTAPTSTIVTSSFGTAFASVNGGASWASINGTGNIVPLESTIGYQSGNSAYDTSTNNIDAGVGDAPASAFTVNSLRFNQAGASAALNGANTIATGGILVTPSYNTAGTVLSGGSIQPGSGNELVVLNYGAAPATIGSTIVDGTSPTNLTISGSGTTVLAAANTHTGGTVLMGSGTLKLANANALQSSTLTVVGLSPTLLFDHAAGAAFAVGALAAANPSLNIALQDTAASPIELHVGGNGVSGVSTDYLGNFSGSGSLVKDGAGGLRLTGSNTYTGGTVLNNGSLYICSANALGTGPLVINGGLIGNNNPGRTATITLATNNPVTINNSFWYAATGFPLDLGSGTVTLANANITIGVSGNNTGLTMGTLVNTSTGAQTLTIAPDASATQSNTFNFGGYVLTNSPGSSVTNTIVGGKIVRFAAPITDGAGTNCGIVFSVAGTVSLRAASTYTGPTTISAGTTLELGTGATGLDGSINSTSGVTNNSVLSYKLFGAATANYAISGTGAVTKAGAGALTLDATNSYSGGTTLSAGVLNVTNSASLGTGPLTITAGSLDNTSGAPLTLPNPQNWNGNFTFVGSNNLDLSTTTVTLGASATVTITANTLTVGAIGEGGSGYALTKAGAGTLTLCGNNTYSGRTTLTAGQLNINAQGTDSGNSAIGTGPLTITAGTIDATNGPIDLSGTTNNAITLGGNFTFGGTNDLNFGTGAITNAGSRTITLKGTNSTLTFGGQMSNNVNGNQTTTVNGPGNTLVLGGYALAAASSTNRTDVITGTGNVTITGPVTNGLSSASGLTYSGTGTLSLTSDASTYTGVTSVSAAGGTLRVSKLADGGSPSSLGQSTNLGTNLLLGNGTTLKYIGSGDSTDRQFRFNGSLAGLGVTLDASGTGPINFTSTTAPTHSSTNQARTLNLTGSNTADNTLAAPLANNGTGVLNVVKNGAGTWALAGSNTYTGGSTVGAGALTFLNTTAKPSSGPTTVAADATLGLGVGLGAPYFVAGDVDSLFAGALTNVTNDANSNVGIDTTAGNFDYTSSVSSTRGLNKLGPNTLTLSGNNTYTGTTYVTAGTLKLAPNSGSALTEHSAVQNDAAFEIAAPAQDVGAISGRGNTSVIGGASLTADSIMQNTLTINANSTVTIASSGTSVINFLQISDGTDFTWGGNSSGAMPAGTNDAGSAGAPSGSAVPEPATWLLIVMAALAGLVAWRRR